MRKIWSVSPFKISILVIVLAVSLYIINVPFFRYMELKSLDLRFKSRGLVEPGSETVIAAIDEKSLSELGRWPWPRTVMARLVDRLTECGAKAVGFDIVFAEPDANSSLKTIEELVGEIRRSGIEEGKLLDLMAKKRVQADTDASLARSIEDAGNVSLGYFFYTREEDALHLSEDEIKRGGNLIKDSRYRIVQYVGPSAEVPVIEAFAAAPNIEVLTRAARNSGYFNAFPDLDGANRWSPLVIRYGENYYPSLALAVLEEYLDEPSISLIMAEYGVEGVRIGDVVIPTDELGRILVNYLGPVKTFPHYSISDIIEGRVDGSLLKDRIVLVGATATGIYDLRVTPFSNAYPGISIHATVIDNILRGSFIQRPAWTGLIDILIIAAVGLLTWFFVSRRRALQGLFIAAVMAVVTLFVNRYVFSAYNLWLNLVYPLATLLAVYVSITVYKYMTEERERKKIRGAFQYYLTASVINEMLQDPSKLKLGGARRDLSVLFSDIRGFTSVSEGMPPEALVQLLNEYLTAMTDVVFRHDGLLDKYMGDAIMAVFGAPVEQRDHSLRACRTALGMMDALKVLRKRWAGEGKPLFDIGIGINSGDMIVGNMGSEMRFDYTVMGDSVNLGSRLEGLNKEYGTNIVISETTRDAVKEHLLCRELDSVMVRGKARPVRIYELMGELNGSRELTAQASLFEEGVAEYKARRWEEAIQAFEGVLELRPGDGPALVYMARCGEYMNNPPGESWDGVYTAGGIYVIS